MVVSIAELFYIHLLVKPIKLTIFGRVGRSFNCKILRDRLVKVSQSCTDNTRINKYRNTITKTYVISFFRNFSYFQIFFTSSSKLGYETCSMIKVPTLLNFMTKSLKNVTYIELTPLGNGWLCVSVWRFYGFLSYNKR